MTRIDAGDNLETADFRTANDAGENGGGSADVGHERVEPETQQHNLIDLDPQDSTAPNMSTETPTPNQISPPKPPPSNNPFLKSKSKESTDVGVNGQRQEDDHTAAWAELIPGSTIESQPVTNGTQIQPTQAQEDAGSAKGKAVSKDDAENHLLTEGQHASASVGAGAASTSTISNLPPPPPRNQTYTIKHVRWLDHRGGDSIRTTPILMQNLNGPCPLLALVNALTMSNPPGSTTPLFDALRTREQVSLNLLLNAVVEELMTGKAAEAGELPDIVELHDFLMALHTGMNVNPAFVPPQETPNLIDFEPGSPMPDTQKRAPGGFEATKEMRLYGIFAVPLVHGWLSGESHPAYPALKRSARTHEDAENLLTREDELETKLASQGLSEDEQRILEDISTIKFYLNSSTTQLTSYGLDTIQDTMTPGELVILFRNNHFSTLYKHPLTHHVFSLVTDMGYAKYDEIVWESLVDVNGAGAELFSGDFRVVSHSSQETGTQERNDASAGRQSQEWTTVDRSNRNRVSRKPVTKEKGEAQAGTTAASSEAGEQEDADLALALQLQEEEEERHRRQSSASAARPPPSIPPRGQSVPEAQHQRRRSSRTQQSQPQDSPSRTPGGSNRLTIRTGLPHQNRIFTDSSANSSTSNVERPLRGAQPSNSPFPAASILTQGRRRRQADPEGPGDEPPPPTYESALEDEPYIPPENSLHHHASPIPSPTIAQGTMSGRSSGPLSVNFDQVLARAQEQEQAQQRSRATTRRTVSSTNNTLSQGRRRSSGGSQVFSQERRERNEKDCVIM